LKKQELMPPPGFAGFVVPALLRLMKVGETPV